MESRSFRGQVSSWILILLLLVLACDFGDLVDDNQPINIACGDPQQLINALNSISGPDQTTIIELANNCTYVIEERYNETFPDNTWGRNAFPLITTKVVINGNDSKIVRSNSEGVDYFRFFQIKEGELHLNDLTLENGNILVDEVGGAIHIKNGSIQIRNCNFVNNDSLSRGGALYIQNGYFNIQDSTFEQNRSQGGGAIFFEGDDVLQLTIDSSIFFNNGKYLGSGGAIKNSGGAIRISNSEFIDNNSGAIYNDGIVELIGSLIQGNSGTGIRNLGYLYITNSTISENSGGDGGGIKSRNSLVVDKSGIYRNYAGGNGGAIYIEANGIANITNTTISGNSAWESGGGIYVEPSAKLNLNFVTLVENRNIPQTYEGSPPSFYIEGTEPEDLSYTVTSPGGGLYLPLSTSNYSIENSVIANNSPDNSAPSELHGTNNLTNDPGIGLLQDNGGPNLTHALLFGSPAIDAIDDCSSINVDQRGISRPQKNGCDIGAFELEDNSTSDLFESSYPDIKKPTTCWGGPGADYAKIGSLSEGDEIDIIGRTDVIDYLVISSPLLEKPCWVYIDDINLNGSDTTGLPLYKSPSGDSQEPPEVEQSKEIPQEQPAKEEPPPAEAPDITPPTLSNMVASYSSIVEEPCTPKRVKVTITVSDSSSILDVKLYHRIVKDGQEGKWLTPNMNAIGENIYQLTLGPDQFKKSLNPYGGSVWQYYVKAWDNNGNIAQTNSSNVQIQVCVQ